MLRRGVGSVLGVVCVLGLAAACGSSSGSQVDPGSSAASGAAGTSGGPNLGNVNGGSASTGGSGNGEDCAADLVEAQRFPLDMYIMLDVSGSMLAATEGDANVSKWQAVSSALTDFVSDPDSVGIGVGLQVFPLIHPDAPETCTTNAECAGFGSCFLKVCWDNPDGLAACESDADCQVGRCVAFGVCENDADYVCNAVGQGCGVDENGQDLGDCQPAPPSQCMITADCRPGSYAAPAAPIAALPGAGPSLVAALQAATPDPNNLTPTGPALVGAIEQAKAWAETHPDHQVVAVLATDGQPTLRNEGASCNYFATALQLNEVAGFAQAGREGTPAISTFVVGVLGEEDATTGAATVLDDIAARGGTTEAFLIGTQGDVQAEFRAALNAIRANGLSCELKVPAAEAGRPVDYDRVNVDFTNQGGTTERLYFVEEASACSAAPGGRGWYFDTKPEEATPRRIIVCQSVCQDFQTVDMGSVRIALGCKRNDVK